jgi:hypothetical protein
MALLGHSFGCWCLMTWSALVSSWPACWCSRACVPQLKARRKWGPGRSTRCNRRWSLLSMHIFLSVCGATFSTIPSQEEEYTQQYQRHLGPASTRTRVRNNTGLECRQEADVVVAVMLLWKRHVDDGTRASSMGEQGWHLMPEFCRRPIIMLFRPAVNGQSTCWDGRAV